LNLDYYVASIKAKRPRDCTTLATAITLPQSQMQKNDKLVVLYNTAYNISQEDKVRNEIVRETTGQEILVCHSEEKTTMAMYNARKKTSEL